ncbi:uncharacterized protein KY384_005802 [Bacidia gigantensis]|uniref:uncharacterized protein n=1 Tax=Bacidia gigantensis TaxID=2732470 RepID=UPI001D0494BB|nr:uncharacterized protein KY384_005802 [Bacidia gigantensis]KAG8529167.1 hypothetical protein KY384_005802 [Bacidia gigantensis]
MLQYVSEGSQRWVAATAPLRNGSTSEKKRIRQTISRGKIFAVRIPYHEILRRSAASNNHTKPQEPKGDSDPATTMAEQPTSYSAFNGTQKLLLAYAASISATFSGLASFIYYPAISALARDLHTSTAKINFTITSYLVVAGLAPSILGDMADRIGRRPISLLAMLLFLGANIGLAIQHSYSALVALRCLQSAGASSTIALAYGIISDISTPAERGSYMGILMGFTNAAPSLGPVLGGVLAEKLTWHWVFWLLTVLSGVHLFALSVFLPETSRKLVGDGSWAPQQWMNKSFASVMFSRKPRRPVSEQKAQISVPNPFHCLVALVNRHNFMIILVGGIQYTIFGCLAASLSVQMIDIYSLNYLTAGLVYLPSGVGGIVAAYLTGRLLDYEYRLTARKHGLPVKKADSDVQATILSDALLEVLEWLSYNPLSDNWASDGASRSSQ